MIIALLFLSKAFAGTLCNDGWVSPSEGSGTCSHHGGGWQSVSSPGVPVDLESPCVLPRMTEADRAAWIAVQTVETLDGEVACLESEKVRLEAERDFLLAHPPTPPAMDFIERAQAVYLRDFGGGVNPQIAQATAIWNSLVERVGEDNARMWLKFGMESDACSVVGDNTIIVKTYTGAVLTLKRGEHAQLTLPYQTEFKEAMEEYTTLASARAPLCNKGDK